MLDTETDVGSIAGSVMDTRATDISRQMIFFHDQWPVSITLIFLNDEERS